MYCRMGAVMNDEWVSLHVGDGSSGLGVVFGPSAAYRCSATLSLSLNGVESS